MFWNTGFDDAPELVRFCLESWIVHNPNWKIVLLDQEAAEKIVPRASLPNEIMVAHYADILRTKILATNGGVWVDATLLCVKPLDDWLLPFFHQTDFFAFTRPGRDRAISNWFLASVPESKLAIDWLALSEEYWKRRHIRYPHYYWHHYLFEFLIRFSRPAAQSFAKMPQINAERCHLLQRYVTKMDAHLPIDSVHDTFVQKLSYKKNISPEHVKDLLSRDLLNDCVK